jgi:hypothetical protein
MKITKIEDEKIYKDKCVVCMESLECIEYLGLIEFFPSQAVAREGEYNIICLKSFF